MKSLICVLSKFLLFSMIPNSTNFNVSEIVYIPNLPKQKPWIYKQVFFFLEPRKLDTTQINDFTVTVLSVFINTSSKVTLLCRILLYIYFQEEKKMITELQFSEAEKKPIKD